MRKIEPYIIGIDATNLSAGGGLTHIIELLSFADPKVHGFDRIVIWAPNTTLKLIEDRPWLDKRNPFSLNKGLFRRTFWQSQNLSQALRNEGCSVLFVPGGSYFGDFHPVVTMSQNLLPFEMSEALRFGWSFLMFKLILLRFTQSRSFKKADGIIFLTKYARNTVMRVTGDLSGQISTIAHGLSARFYKIPKLQKNISLYSEALPYKVLYVSIIDQYKHQWHVVEAVSHLRDAGIPIVLDLIGPAYPPALKRLNSQIDSLEGNSHWVKYHGSIAFEELHQYYTEADVGLFASSCENMPFILMETMASGLPIACSNRGPMPEILGEAGVYFNPELPEDIAAALLKLIQSEQLRTELSLSSYEKAQRFTWERCANETFRFINLIEDTYKKQINNVQK